MTRLLRFRVPLGVGRERCLEKWAPTASYLDGCVSGRHFRIVPLDFEQIDDAVEAGDIDFILANSAIYARLEHLYHVNRGVTLKALHGEEALTMFGGVIFMRRDAGIAPLLSNLAARRFAAVKENSFGGWLMACRELRMSGIDPDRDFGSLTFSGTHDQVVYDVLEGKVDASAPPEPGQRKAGSAHADPAQVAHGFACLPSDQRRPLMLSVRRVPRSCQTRSITFSWPNSLSPIDLSWLRL